ncbi:hypothetical protein [Zoogloea sp.]|uniref:hypothetical protein n=1 Tax=Zoogloea sp. TaxID=49181 RepID=UPI00321F9D14
MKPVFSSFAAIFAAVLIQFATPGISAAQSCPPHAAKPTKEPAYRYFVQKERLWRTNGNKSEPMLIETPTGNVLHVAQSVLNCNEKLEMQREPNLLAIAMDDESIWIRGILIDYRLQTGNRPKRFLDTRGQWKKISHTGGVKSLAAGEGFIAILGKDDRVWIWGHTRGNRADWFGYEQSDKMPLLLRSSKPVETTNGITKVLAYNDAVYMLDRENTLKVLGGMHLCRISADRVAILAFDYFCTPFNGAIGPVRELTMSWGANAGCHAKNMQGSVFSWQCDDEGANGQQNNIVPTKLD